MKFEVLEKDKNYELIEVVFDKESLSKKMDSEIEYAKKEYKFPGFRQGKVPRGLIVKSIGEEKIKEAAFESLLEMATEELFEEKRFIEEPRIVEKDLKDLKVKFELFLTPEVILPDFKELKVFKNEINREQLEILVTKSLEGLLEDNAVLEPKDGLIEFGDMVKMKYSVSNEGGKEIFASKSEDHIIYEDDYRPIIQNIVGKKRGETVAFERTFDDPKKGNSEEEKKLSFKYTVIIEEVYTRLLPELDDNFARFFDEKFNTLEELKESLKKENSILFDKNQINLIKNQIIDKLVENSSVEVSDKLLNEISMENLKELKKKDDYEKLLTEFGSEEKIIEDLKKNETNTLKLFLAVQKISDENGFEPTEDEIKDFAEDNSAAWELEPEKARAIVSKNNKFKNELSSFIKKDKVAEFLLDKVTVEVLPEPEDSQEEIKTKEAKENDEKENDEKENTEN